MNNFRNQRKARAGRISVAQEIQPLTFPLTGLMSRAAANPAAAVTIMAVNGFTKYQMCGFRSKTTASVSLRNFFGKAMARL